MLLRLHLKKNKARKRETEKDWMGGGERRVNRQQAQESDSAKALGGRKRGERVGGWVKKAREKR